MAELILGRDVGYPVQYSPEILFPIARIDSRAELGIDNNKLPFVGADIWNAYELSWLNEKGKPQVACAELRIPCESKFIIESKSLKLYLNSLNNEQFASFDQVASVIAKDLSACAAADIAVTLSGTDDNYGIDRLEGYCIDELDISIDQYRPDPALLSLDSHQMVSEQLSSHLLRSLCPVTAQPDWASIQIEYSGPKIRHEGLLRYLVGFRQHQEFHEQCVERIFNDIYHRCRPESLSVQAFYTRRGGLDINPFRSLNTAKPAGRRLFRQ